MGGFVRDLGTGVRRGRGARLALRLQSINLPGFKQGLGGARGARLTLGLQSINPPLETERLGSYLKRMLQRSIKKVFEVVASRSFFEVA